MVHPSRSSNPRPTLQHLPNLQHPRPKKWTVLALVGIDVAALSQTSTGTLPSWILNNCPTCTPPVNFGCTSYDENSHCGRWWYSEDLNSSFTLVQAGNPPISFAQHHLSTRIKQSHRNPSHSHVVDCIVAKTRVVIHGPGMRIFLALLFRHQADTQTEACEPGCRSSATLAAIADMHCLLQVPFAKFSSG